MYNDYINTFKYTMSKLKKLILNWESGNVYTTEYLNTLGYSTTLLARYKYSNWIQSLGKGAFIKNGDLLNWKGGVLALQEQLNLKVHIGAASALKLYGISHYAYRDKEKIFLFAEPSVRLPKWFSDQKWDQEIKYFSSKLFKTNVGILSKKIDGFTLKMSSRERALFEQLYLVPKFEDSIESARLFEGLKTLRADLIQKLLEECNSIKVKRLFMYISEKLDYPWVRKLDLNNIDFGTGARTIDKGGKMNSKYKIVVKEDRFGVL